MIIVRIILFDLYITKFLLHKNEYIEISENL